MKFNRKNIYLKPEIYIEEFDDVDEGFMAGSDGFVETGNGDSEGENPDQRLGKESSFYTPFNASFDDFDE